MIVRDEYQCLSCNEQKSCFVFDEFASPFALCMECYVRMKSEHPHLPHSENNCMLCDTTKESTHPFRITNPIIVHSTLHICDECFERFSKLVEDKRYL